MPPGNPNVWEGYCFPCPTLRSLILGPAKTSTEKSHLDL